MTHLAAAIVGPIGAGADSLSGASVRDVGQGYDFAIGPLGFHAAPSDDAPYERATAQFRKEQLDTSQNYGDQSLLGYWTRGQFSFHHGAGVKYYELTDGEDVLNRYSEGAGVNPFKPGEVTLHPGWQAATPDTYVSVTDVAAVTTSILAVLHSAKVTYGALGAAGTVYDPVADVVAMTAGGGNIYCALSDKTISRIIPGSAAVVVYSHAKDIKELFYAKDRLLMMDAGGTWHQLAPNPSGVLPVAVASGDVMFTATGTGRWTACDTPGPILFGNGSRIFSVSQDSASGAFPTLTAPVQVADLPVGEDVLALSGYLGFLAIVTAQGVRAGVMADSGSVTYGPRLVDWTAPPGRTTIARRGESVFVAGERRLIEVNFGAQIGQTLEFGWAELPTLLAGTETSYGLTSVGTTLVAWADSAVSRQATTPAASGTLTTGFHRFSTLELKKFQTVRIRVGGGGGSVSVAKVVAGGSVVPLHTINVATSAGEDITLRMDTPAEMVGLKFTLTADGANSPTLLGYQLRALPAPKRQRMIRVPLLLHDVGRRGTTRAMGRTGSAWERLSALETMEETGGTFVFQDFRTGESGQCFIESVEHKGTTPPGRQSDGFGGLVWLTLRKL